MSVNNNKNRPVFPKRAVITAGMPYGNKDLHFGHIGGPFVNADFYARFLRDRIGYNNVVFVSGIDCYGSMIEIDYNKLKEQTGYNGDITDFVKDNYIKQKSTLDKFDISLNLYAASALGESGRIHSKMSEEVFNKLYASGKLHLINSKQFYDSKHNAFLNGRQVTGYCPIRGCKSEIAYANECALGHQYNETDLLNPKSILSGETPELKETPNWYFDLEWYRSDLEKWVCDLSGKDNCRANLISVLNEFLKDPVIYTKKDYQDQLEKLKDRLPEHVIKSDENKASFELVFKKLSIREEACEILDKNNIRYRTGKTLVPFRISGNANWGIPIPEKDGIEGLTFWVWPESLWAPISFTKTFIESNKDFESDWEKWWKSKESKIYQFVGEDNIYFYGLAEPAMFMAWDNGLQMPEIISNHHLLYMGSKASSSGKVKAPKAYEFLDYYTLEQLKMHFLSMALASKSVSFEPRAVEKAQNAENSINSNIYDPVLKEGNILTNVFNRLIRSCFYTNQKYFSNKYPTGDISKDVREFSEDTILKYETHMYKFEFNKVVELLEGYIQYGSKYWAAKSKEAGEDKGLVEQVLIDCFHIVKVAMTLLHPIAPAGCEMIREYLNIGSGVWNWDDIFESVDYFIENKDKHELKFLEPRVDFFVKHETQLSK